MASIGHIVARTPSGEVLSRAQQRAMLVPDCLVEARRIANTVITGWHGRRKRGIGENFWQFRPYSDGESFSRIDWRRSAKDDHTYVRDREWEAAHTIWLWADLSPSMMYKSTLGAVSKESRALVLMLALAEILARSGERIGCPGVMEPVSARNAAERLATAIMHSPLAEGLPDTAMIRGASDLVLIGDFLDPADRVMERLGPLARRGLRGHVVEIADPAEEVFPYAGRTEFTDPETGEKLTADVPRSCAKTTSVPIAPAATASARACAISAGPSFRTERIGRRRKLWSRCICIFQACRAERPMGGLHDRRPLLHFCQPRHSGSTRGTAGDLVAAAHDAPKTCGRNLSAAAHPGFGDEARGDPSKSPWWLTLLRMLMAAAVIFAIADPVFNPRSNTLATSGPLALLIDNSWATAPDWERRVEAASALIDDAEAKDVAISIVFTGERQHDATPGSASTARNRLAAARPEPLPADRGSAIAALQAAFEDAPPGTVAFLTDGIEGGDGKTMEALAGSARPVSRYRSGRQRGRGAHCDEQRVRRHVGDGEPAEDRRRPVPFPFVAFDTRAGDRQRGDRFRTRRSKRQGDDRGPVRTAQRFGPHRHRRSRDRRRPASPRRRLPPPPVALLRRRST